MTKARPYNPAAFSKEELEVIDRSDNGPSGVWHEGLHLTNGELDELLDLAKKKNLEVVEQRYAYPNGRN